MEINIDYYHRLAETESDPQKLKVEMLKLLQTTVDILLAAKRSEIETANSGQVEQLVMDKTYKAAQSLFDNRLGWSSGANPYAPRDCWADLGATLYGEDDSRVKELREKTGP